MTPLKALKADSYLPYVILGGFALLVFVVIVGVIEKAIDLTVIAGILGSLVSATISVVVVVAVKGPGGKEDHRK